MLLWGFWYIVHNTYHEGNCKIIQKQIMTTITTLLEYLAQYGGRIVSTNSLSIEDIEQARAGGRMYVDDNSLGYVWEPEIKQFPETTEEVELFEKWYPLPPKNLKDIDFFKLFKSSTQFKP